MDYIFTFINCKQDFVNILTTRKCSHSAASIFCVPLSFSGVSCTWSTVAPKLRPPQSTRVWSAARGCGSKLPAHQQRRETQHPPCSQAEPRHPVVVVAQYAKDIDSNQLQNTKCFYFKFQIFVVLLLYYCRGILVGGVFYLHNSRALRLWCSRECQVPLDKMTASQKWHLNSF